MTITKTNFKNSFQPYYSQMNDYITLPKQSCLYVISDIHGDHQSLLEALKIILPEIEERKRYLVILGDNIDRFPRSKEVMEEIMYLKSSYGDKIILLVGNHEYQYLGGLPCYPKTYQPSQKEIGFMEENFVYFVLTDEAILLHGGVPKGFSKIEDIERTEIKTQIVWNDPDPRAKDFLPSPRTGYDPLIPIYVYGQNQLNSFLEVLDKKLLISGHGHINDTPLLGQVRVCSSRICLDSRRSILKIFGKNIERIFF